MTGAGARTGGIIRGAATGPITGMGAPAACKVSPSLGDFITLLAL